MPRLRIGTIPPMTKRREKRSHLAVPVRLKGEPRATIANSENACTLDVTPRGARLQSNARFEVGDIVWVERGTRRAQFKVAWVGSPGTPKSGQIGIEIVEKKFSWSGELRALDDEPYEEHIANVVAEPAPQEAVPRAKEFKSNRRHPCSGHADVSSESGRMLVVNGRLKEISGRGCYVATNAPFAVRTNVLLTLQTKGLTLETPGVVRTADSGGMWIDFAALPAQDRLTLQHFIENLPE